MTTRSAPAVPLGSLTDAELAFLTRPRTRVGPRPVMPVWSRLDTVRRTAAARQARASLVSRRLLDAGTAGGLRRDLRCLLALRAVAAAVAAVSRATPVGRDHWYAHLVHDVVVLEEVSTDGVHRFALAAAATLPDLVVAAVLHPAASASPVAAPHGTDDRLRADLELRTVTGCRRWAWVSGPGGTWQAPPGRTDVRAEPVDPADVRLLLRDALADLDLGEVGDAG